MFFLRWRNQLTVEVHAAEKCDAVHAAWVVVDALQVQPLRLLAVAHEVVVAVR